MALPPPSNKELPSIRRLNRASLLAAGVAAVIVVTAVLPAEFGIDPTGVGRAFGLTMMGQAKLAAAEETSADLGEPVTAVLPDGSTEVRLVLKPQQGKEVKATMKADQEFTYRWSTNGAKLEFELHGDPEGAAEEDYMSYEKGESAGASGTFRAPFDGRHGWYWKNNSDEPVTLVANAKGDFGTFGVLD
jgi:hypothetical protein